MRLALLLLAGCATYSEYTCPAPIGVIVRDDCAAYETRYEALGVELGFSFQGVGVTAKVSEDKLRDASELIQLLRHQSLALCRDFNACRLASADYQARREGIDRTFTAIHAITQQLESPALRPEERPGLLDSMIALLRGEKAPPPKPEPPRVARDPFYRPRPPRRIPPLTPVARGVPRIGKVEAYPQRYPKAEVLHLELIRFADEDVQDDDRLELSTGGRTIECKVRRSRHGGSARCDVKGEVGATASLRYRPGLAPAWHDLGEIPLATPEGRVFLAFETEEAHGELFERPHLVIFAPGGDALYLRCAVGDRAIDAPIRSRSARAFFGHRHSFALPFVVSTGDGTVLDPPADRLGPAHIGTWTCRGATNARFAIDAEGHVDASAPVGAFQPGWFELKP